MSKETATVNRRRLWTVGAGAVGATALLGQAPAEATTPLDGKVSRLLLNRKSLSRKALERTLRDMGILDAPAPGQQAPGAAGPVATPSGFSWTTHPLVGKLFVDQYGVFSSTLDPTTYKYATGTTYYVDNVAGNDANDGLTAGTALQRIYTAAAKADVRTIMVKSNGVANPYYRARGMNAIALTKNINIIGYGGDVYVTTHDLLTWTLTAGTSNTYQAARSSVSEVVDMVGATAGSGAAAGVQLTKVANQAAVETTPGSWYSDGTTVWVRPSTARAADANIWALLSTVNFRNTGDYTTYLENLIFMGGSECIRAAGGSSAGGFAVLNNVEAHMSQNAVGNNIAINGCDGVLVNVESTRSGSDGLGYHALNGKVPRIVEIHCRATSCGHSSDDQCSTMHDGGKIIRVNGTYRTSTGATVADVNDGTESWNLGCAAEDSSGGYNWKLGNDSGSPKMWLHRCTAKGARWSAYAYGTAQIKTRGTRLERTSGNVTTY